MSILMKMEFDPLATTHTRREIFKNRMMRTFYLLWRRHFGPSDSLFFDDELIELCEGFIQREAKTPDQFFASFEDSMKSKKSRWFHNFDGEKIRWLVNEYPSYFAGEDEVLYKVVK